MSIEVSGLVQRARLGLGPHAKLVLLGLADHAHDDGTNAWPGVKTLAQYAECSERSVQRKLADLAQAGFVSIQRKATPRFPTIYKIHLAELAALRPPVPGDKVSPLVVLVDASEQVSDEPRGAHDPTEDNVSPLPLSAELRGDRSGVRGDKLGARGDTALSPEPSVKQPSTDQPSKPLAPTSSTRAPDPIFEILFALETGKVYAPEIRHELTPSASATLNQAAAQIRATGVAPDELVQAIGAWPAVMPPRSTCTASAVAKHLPRLRAAAGGMVASRSEFDSNVAEAARLAERRRASQEAIA